jgi:hypothetical protein
MREREGRVWRGAGISFCDFLGRLSWFLFESGDFLEGNIKVIKNIMTFDTHGIEWRAGRLWIGL